eukprot:TRINITY_DN3244_c0_g1_i1.p1 TRINITY_DN3244_c0_g1~~TRINITY_DN3244_c0_g1_i1.p1  ORF type:complete len:298 (-),score=149.22 TRINITY_DN3244_c0_g1_i1:52-945(-)
MAFNANADAQALHAAMKGLGCDDDGLIRILGVRSNAQVQEIREEFAKLYGKSLDDALEGETRGDFEKIVLALCEPTPRYDAKNLIKAIKGAGTNEALLIEILTHRNNGEMLAINAEYSAITKRTLYDDITSDTSAGTFQRLFQKLCSGGRDESAPRAASVETDAHAIRFESDAMKNDFVDLLASKGEDYLKAFRDEWAKQHSDSLDESIKKNFSGDAERALLALARPSAQFYAEQLFDAFKGIGTNEDKVIRIIVSRRHELAAIKFAYAHQFKQTLSERAADELSGSLKKLVLALLC